MTGEGVQQHYALQDEWQRRFALRSRQWAISAGRSPADASREAIDRAVSEALLERGVSRGASPSSVKKWRTGRFAPPPAEVLTVLETLLGTGSELSSLLAAITADAPGTGADPQEGTGSAPAPADDDGSAGGADPYPEPDVAAAPRRRTRRLVLAVSVVVAAAVLIVAAVILNRRSSGEVSAGRDADDGSCAIAVGSLPDELSQRPSAAKWEESFAAAHEAGGGRTGVGCPTAPVEEQGAILVQLLPGPAEGAPGALVVVADEPKLRFFFNAALWASYRRLRPRDGSGAQMEVGVPVAIRPDADGHVEVELDNRMLLVAQEDDAPYFFIPPRYVAWWRANKEQVGLPMGNPRPGAAQQDTERGYATAPRNAAVPEMHVVPDPAAGLPAEVKQGGVIIAEPEGTDWWILADGRRQWIADVGTWTCLGGIAKTVSDQVPGAAVATLEYAGIATCED